MNSLYMFGILYSFLLCILGYFIAIKIVYPRVSDENFVKHILLFYIFRTLAILLISFLILKFLLISQKVFLISLFLFYFIFKLLEVFHLNKMKSK